MVTEITEEKLNMFIDEQLDADEMDMIHEAMFEDKTLRERVCQLRAVRELVGYAYTNVPGDKTDTTAANLKRSPLVKAIAASVLLIVGMFLGWETYEYSPNSIAAISAENTFQYVANHVSVDHGTRKIVLHIDSGDLKTLNAALNEVDHLLATYKKANVPMKMDVITNKDGIDMLRPGVSPYIDRIQKMIDDDDVSFFACERSIAKAHDREGTEIVLMPGVTTNKSARDLIPDRIKKGWVYIKA